MREFECVVSWAEAIANQSGDLHLRLRVHRMLGHGHDHLGPDPRVVRRCVSFAHPSTRRLNLYGSAVICHPRWCAMPPRALIGLVPLTLLPVSGMIQAITNRQIGLKSVESLPRLIPAHKYAGSVITELLVGFILPGRPVAMMMFVSFFYIYYLAVAEPGFLFQVQGMIQSVNPNLNVTLTL